MRDENFDFLKDIVQHIINTQPENDIIPSSPRNEIVTPIKDNNENSCQSKSSRKKKKE